MERKREYDICLELLRRVVIARGNDPAGIAAQYPWPEARAPERPNAAVSLAPLLTGGGHAQPAATGTGVVPMPPGLTPPKT
jgi:hypothetical protein